MTGPYDMVDPNEYPEPPRDYVRIRGSADLTGSLRPLALLLYALFVAEIVLDVVLVPALLHQRSAVLGVDKGTSSVADVHDADGLATNFSRTSFVVVLAIAIVFVVWFYRARANVEHYEPRFQRRTPGWALGGWLPIVNLWVPYQITTDILLDSDRPLTGPPRTERRGYGLVQAWWTLWLIRLALMFATRTVDKDTPHGFANYDLFQVAYQVSDLAGAVLAILVIDRVTKAQRQRHAESVRPAAP